MRPSGSLLCRLRRATHFLLFKGLRIDRYIDVRDGKVRADAGFMVPPPPTSRGASEIDRLAPAVDPCAPTASMRTEPGKRVAAPCALPSASPRLRPHHRRRGGPSVRPIGGCRYRRRAFNCGSDDASPAGRPRNRPAAPHSDGCGEAALPATSPHPRIAVQRPASDRRDQNRISNLAVTP